MQNIGNYLLLAPNNLSVGVLAGLLLDKIVGERRDLLDARNDNITDVVLLAGLQELVVDLASTENETLDGGGRD